MFGKGFGSVKFGGGLGFNKPKNETSSNETGPPTFDLPPLIPTTTAQTNSLVVPNSNPFQKSSSASTFMAKPLFPTSTSSSSSLFQSSFDQLRQPTSAVEQFGVPYSGAPSFTSPSSSRQSSPVKANAYKWHAPSQASAIPEPSRRENLVFLSDTTPTNGDQKAIRRPVLSINSKPAARSVTRKSSSVGRSNLSPEQLKQCTTLRISNIPESRFTQSILTNHFKLLAPVTKVILRKSGQERLAVVHFESHEGAKRAKVAGSVMSPGIPALKFQWVLSQPLTSPGGRRPQPPVMTAGPGRGGGTGANSRFKLVKSAIQQAQQKTVQKQRIIPDLMDTTDALGFGSEVNTTQRNAFKPLRPTAPVRPRSRPIEEGGGTVGGMTLRSGVELRNRLLEKTRGRSASPQSGSSTAKRPINDTPVIESKQLFVGDVITRTSAATARHPVSSAFGEVSGNSVTTIATSKISHGNLVAQLSALVGRRATNSCEKWQILDERDKILRKFKPEKVAVGVGNCPDMCPEKERYQREYQLSVSRYEGTGGLIEARKAVKDYQRSSADQDEPLPHDLRPGPVLSSTIDYLLTYIVKDDPPSESVELPIWFDFMWKRTRQIRKDLTQQQLTNQCAVDLFEQCARFHIFAAHWLCELDISDFDQRMNTENLTKCVQSLQQLYEDLYQLNIESPTEPEFRSYQVLLNLNDTNFLRKALSWRPAVRNHPSVRFAIKMLLVVQENNYVQFFKRVKSDSCSYLQACLLHRYFGQVRTEAMTTILRAYSTNSQFPIEDLVSMLAFETDDECVEFCEAHSMEVAKVSSLTAEGNYLVVNKQHFSIPQNPPDQNRAFRLVEYKRLDTPLSKVIHGSTVEYRHDCYSPVNSFDAQGCYKNDPVIASYLSDTPIVGQSSAPEQRKALEGFRSPQVESKDLIAQREKALTDGAIQLIFSEILTEVIVRELKPILVDLVAAKSFLQLENDVMLPEICEIAKNCLTEQRASRSAKTALLSNFGEQLCAEVVMEECQKIIRKTLKSSLKKRCDQLAREHFDQMLEEITSEEISRITADVYDERVDRVRIGLARIRQNLNRIKMRQFVTFWRSKASALTARKRYFEQFPTKPMLTNDEQCLNLLLGGSRSTIAKRHRFSSFDRDQEWWNLGREAALLDGARNRAWHRGITAECLSKIGDFRSSLEVIAGPTRGRIVRCSVFCFVDNPDDVLKRWIVRQFGLSDCVDNTTRYQLSYNLDAILSCELVNSSEFDEESIEKNCQRSDILIIYSSGENAMAKKVMSFVGMLRNCLVQLQAKCLQVLCVQKSGSTSILAGEIQSLQDFGLLTRTSTISVDRLALPEAKTDLQNSLSELIQCQSLNDRLVMCRLQNFICESILLTVRPLSELQENDIFVDAKSILTMLLELTVSLKQFFVSELMEIKQLFLSQTCTILDFSNSWFLSSEDVNEIVLDPFISWLDFQLDVKEFDITSNDMSCFAIREVTRLCGIKNLSICVSFTAFDNLVFPEYQFLDGSIITLSSVDDEISTELPNVDDSQLSTLEMSTTTDNRSILHDQIHSFSSEIKFEKSILQQEVAFWEELIDEKIDSSINMEIVYL